MLDTQFTETNILDLGIWVNVQHQVRCFHRLLVMQKDELTKKHCM